MGSADHPGRGLPLIADGASAQVYALPDGRVLKSFHAAVSDEMVAREAVASSLAGSLGLPAAGAIARLGAERVTGEEGRGLIFPRIDGMTMMRAIRARPWTSGKLLKMMSELLVATHRHMATELRPVTQVLATDIRYGPAPLDLQDAVCAYLDRLPQGNALLHGDYHLGNIIMSAQGPVIIDWAKAATGAPAADLARTEMLMRFGQGASDVATNLWRDWAAWRLVRDYLRGGAVSVSELAAWRPVVAVAWLRARAPVRQAAFLAYCNRALADAGLPVLRLQ
ncbi:MAG: aminoglycoside phosphotransferase family protein [Sphingobium sp.]